MNIVERRGRWVLTDSNGMVSKFATKKEAQDAAGWVPPVEETLDGSTEEEKSSKEEAGTDEQASVFSSKKPSKKKI